MDEQVTLTAYADQVRELIRNDRNDEAIAICKHTLRYYPKSVDAYRQLGEALLEKGRLDDAKELFRRVLGADPESVVAYAGLAVILEQEQLVAEATWHMERAYELAPGNVELHKELHRLYHELDGRPRARLKLTPGALARLYVQEGLFAQAIQELNALVAGNDARFDARVALAETLWRVGQMRQAADVAQAILKPLPFCLKANLILGAVWKETGLTESEQYLQRAQELEPTNLTAQRIFGARSPLPFVQARVPRYVEGAPVTPPLVAEMPAPVQATVAARQPEAPADLLRESPGFDEAAFKPPLLDTTLPPWLLTPIPEIVEEKPAPIQTAEPVAETQIEPSGLLTEAEKPQPEPAAETPGELPAWLVQLRESGESSEAKPQVPVEPTAEPESALPPWMRTESKVEEPAPATPSWIEEAKSATEAEVSPALKEEIAPEEAPTLPTWIASESRAEETTLSQPESQPRAEELSTWVSQFTPQPEPAPIASTVEPPQPEAQPREEEIPAWLSQPAPQPEPAPVAEPPVAAPAKPSAVAPKRKPATRGDSHLILARAYRDANQFQEALGEYDYIVQKAPRLINQVIPDLETLAQQAGVPLEVHRILGDAYTRADRLAEALEEYRFVLGRVAS
ncbi:MAG: tetratricopeptide repeat protein [Anaerolineales bacterium]|nr:tetratricopeptide repeat protein [Anaerolineales bacterium]